MDLIQIMFIFMLMTSLTLTGFVIRQRKNNRMLGELVAQTKVNGYNQYSTLNVGKRNQEYVSKCPSCAEWINLEAKVCKSCQANVMEHNSAKKEEMEGLDQEIREFQVAKARHDKERLRSFFKSKIFRISVAAVLVVILFFAITNILSEYRYIKATAMPASASAVVNSWESIITECRVSSGTGNPIVRNSSGYVSLEISMPSNLESFNWDSVLGKEIICFSDKALGIDVSKKLSLYSVNNINLRNGYSAGTVIDLFDQRYLAFYWK